MRVCKVCGEAKPLSEYYKVKKDGKFYHGKCKTCYVALQQQKYTKEKGRDANLRHKYGITTEQYNFMLQAQGGVCAICKTDEPGGRRSGRGGSAEHFFVDHNHTTGEVRGLLCNSCNRVIGLVKEDVDTLKCMKEYLDATG